LQYLAQVALTSQQLGANAVQHNFYVEDCLSRDNTLEEARKQRDRICTVLGSEKLMLRKWCSTHPEMIKNIPKSGQTLDLDFSKFSDATIETLGIVWNP